MQSRICVALGVDEKVMNRASRGRRRRYVTVLVNLATGRPLDIVERRSKRVLKAWLAAQTQTWRDAVRIVALDPAAPYRAALTDPQVGLHQATLVVDRFHMHKLANTAIGDTRRRVQQDTPRAPRPRWRSALLRRCSDYADLGAETVVDGRVGRFSWLRGRHKLYRARRLLVIAQERLDDRAHAKLTGLLAAGDPHGEVATAWHAKEAIRELYAHHDPKLVLEWVDQLSAPTGHSYPPAPPRDPAQI